MWTAVDSPIATRLRAAARDLGFEMSCTAVTGALLRVLVASKPGGRILELGTGAGVGTSYLAEGLHESASLTSVEIDPAVQSVARQHLGCLAGVTFLTVDAGTFLETSRDRFDVIFADTWAGKFTHLEKALARLSAGGLYVIDDLLPQPNWPEGHSDKVERLLADLTDVPFLRSVRLSWDTGIAIYARHG